MKYPIGIQSFERIIEGGYVYVDKTELIYRLTHIRYFMWISTEGIIPMPVSWRIN